MGIDLSRYKVVYNDRVLRALCLDIVHYGEDFPSPSHDGSAHIVKPESLTVLAINEDGNLVAICDDAWRFQFIPVILQEVKP